MAADDRIEAAELALGLLDGAEHAAAVARVREDPDFAADLVWWRARLATMLDSVSPVAPPPDLVERIAARLDTRSDLPARRSRAAAWRWAGGGVVGGALAASLALVMVRPAQPPTPPRVAEAPRPVTLFVTVLAPAQGRPGAAIAAVVDPAGRVIRLPGAISAPSDRVAQLWRIGRDGTPRPLGLLRADGPTRLTLPDGTLPAPADTLAVSIEPRGGSPTGLPTGPVVASGVLTRS